MAELMNNKYLKKNRTALTLSNSTIFPPASLNSSFGGEVKNSPATTFPSVIFVAKVRKAAFPTPTKTLYDIILGPTNGYK